MKMINLTIEMTEAQYAAMERRAARMGSKMKSDRWTTQQEIELTAAGAVLLLADEEIRTEQRAVENAQINSYVADRPIRVVAAHKEAGEEQALSDDTKGEPQATGGKLTRSGGVHMGPSGKETWYNLPMGGVIRIMRDLGYTEEEWPYRIREEDGCKMLGDYIMIAANLELRPRGSIVETSLGPGIVCDTGSFANKDQTAVDIAVNW